MKFGVRRHNRTRTKVRWWKFHFRKSNMADGCHFKNHYISISQPRIDRIARNLVHRTNFDPSDGNVIKFRNSKIQNGGWSTHWKSLFGYNSAAYCPIKMEFGVRRQNRITRIRFDLMIKMPNYLRTSTFQKSLYLCIWDVNRPSLTKFGTQTQILTQPRKLDKHKSEINTNKKLSWCWQTRATRLEVSQGHQTVPFHMVGILSSCAIVTLSLRRARFSYTRLQKMSWHWNPGQRSLKVIESGTIR